MFCRRFQQFLSGNQSRWVGDFQVATGGGFWVAIRAAGLILKSSDFQVITDRYLVAAVNATRQKEIA